MSLKHINASNGSGEAVLAKATSIRTAGSTVLIPDFTTNFPQFFIATTGKQLTSGAIDPATVLVFFGHLNASQIIIDSLAPGYTDNGSSVGDIIVIKPTTAWADNFASLLGVAHNDDGTIKDDAISKASQFADPVDPVLRAADTMFDHVSSGAVLAGLGYGALLTASLSAGIAYINGNRQVITAVPTRAYTASKDTYVDALYNASGTATIVYTEVANNAASPALAANSIRLGIVVTGANILNVGSINQGQVTSRLPIVSSAYLTVVDSLGNMICPRDLNKKILAYRTRITNISTTTAVSPAELSMPVQVPTGRRVKLVFAGQSTYNSNANGGVSVDIMEGGTFKRRILTYAPALPAQVQTPPNASIFLNPSAGLHTYLIRVNEVGGSGTANMVGSEQDTTGATIEFSAELA